MTDATKLATPSAGTPDGEGAEADEGMRYWFRAADHEFGTIQRIADGHLRGKVKHAPKNATLTIPLTDLLTITCCAASGQQDVRAAAELFAEEYAALRRRLSEVEAGYRCYYCNEVFTGDAARDHFNQNNSNGARSVAQCLRDAADAQVRAAVNAREAAEAALASLRQQLADALARAEAAEREAREWEEQVRLHVDAEAKCLARARAAERERDVVRADVVYAAGECLIPVPEPGSDMARVCLANSQLRRQRDEVRSSLASLQRDAERLRERVEKLPGVEIQGTLYLRESDVLAALHPQPEDGQ